jgi:dephospho-CoA kinase
MLKVALTGGIACGKSLVGTFLADLGWEVCDADDLAHDAMRPGGPAYAGVVRAFGRGIVESETGMIDRGRLAAIVFADPASLRKLNAIVHPHVRNAWRDWLQSPEAKRRSGIVIIPLLYEADVGREWDVVVCVNASRRTQIARLLKRGLTTGDAERRIDAQLPAFAKMARADFVVVNDGSREALQMQVAKVWRHVEGML